MLMLFLYVGFMVLWRTAIYKTEKYKKHTIHRAEDNIYIRGKLYKKGQFLPKQKEL